MVQKIMALLTIAFTLTACKSSGFLPEGKKENSLNITRTFDAPRSAVWKAWTDAKLIKKWYGPLPFTCPYAKNDLKVGGKYLYAMRSPEKKDYWSTGHFVEIVPEQKIVSTDSFSDKNGNIVDPKTYGMPADMPREMLVTVTFEDAGAGKTKFSVKQAGMPKSMEADAHVGWTTMLDKFAKVAEKVK
jgi:uncharacterized protein YndB with AHSA1/START domain